MGRYAVAGLLVGPVVDELVTRVGWPGLLVGAPVGAAVGALAAALALARRWGVVALTVAAIVGGLGRGMLAWLVANAIVSS